MTHKKVISYFGTSVLALLSATGPLFAHSFAYYASTPITPPGEFIWWYPFSFFFMLIGTYIPTRKILRKSMLYSGLIAVAWVTVFTLVFFMMGSFAASISTAPPPGLGLLGGTYWGRDFSFSQSIFLTWNLIGVTFFSSLIFVFYKILKRRKQDFSKGALLGWGGVMPLCFLICLTPYIATGAWLHGWAGGHVIHRCDDQLSRIHFAIILYALDHDYCMPVADDYETLHEFIRPYYEKMKHRHEKDGVQYCVLGQAFERKPKEFFWSSAYSGKKIQRKRLTWNSAGTEPAFSYNKSSEGVVQFPQKWVTCPYRPDSWHIYYEIPKNMEVDLTLFHVID